MENNRENLEEKINLEIKELKRPWYKKSSNIITLSIAVITFGLTLRSGIVETTRKELQAEKQLLRDSIQIFKDSINTVKIKNNEYQKAFNEYQQKEMSYLQELREKNKKDEIIEYYKNKLDSLTGIKIFNETFDETFK